MHYLQEAVAAVSRCQIANLRKQGDTIPFYQSHSGIDDRETCIEWASLQWTMHNGVDASLSPLAQTLKHEQGQECMK
jgi:hypothetical protein